MHTFGSFLSMGLFIQSVEFTSTYGKFLLFLLEQIFDLCCCNAWRELHCF